MVITQVRTAIPQTSETVTMEAFGYHTKSVAKAKLRTAIRELYDGESSPVGMKLLSDAYEVQLATYPGPIDDSDPLVHIVVKKNSHGQLHAVAVHKSGREQVFSTNKAVDNFGKDQWRVDDQRLKSALRLEVRKDTGAVTKRFKAKIIHGDVVACNICEENILDPDNLHIDHAGERDFVRLAHQWMTKEGLLVGNLKLKDAPKQEGNLLADPARSSSWLCYHRANATLEPVHADPCHHDKPKCRLRLPRGED